MEINAHSNAPLAIFFYVEKSTEKGTEKRSAPRKRPLFSENGFFSVKILFLPAQAPEPESPLFFRKTHGRKRNKTLMYSHNLNQREVITATNLMEVGEVSI